MCKGPWGKKICTRVYSVSLYSLLTLLVLSRLVIIDCIFIKKFFEKCFCKVSRKTSTSILFGHTDKPCCDQGNQFFFILRRIKKLKRLSFPTIDHSNLTEKIGFFDFRTFFRSKSEFETIKVHNWSVLIDCFGLKHRFVD